VQSPSEILWRSLRVAPQEARAHDAADACMIAIPRQAILQVSAGLMERAERPVSCGKVISVTCSVHGCILGRLIWC